MSEQTVKCKKLNLGKFKNLRVHRQLDANLIFRHIGVIIIFELKWLLFDCDFEVSMNGKAGAPNLVC